MLVFVTKQVREYAGERLDAAAPAATFVVGDYEGGYDGGDPDAVEAALLSPDLYTAARDSDAAKGTIVRVARAERLDWAHTGSAGVDHSLFRMLLRRGVTLTNSPGVHAVPIAEWVIAQMLSVVKRMPDHASLQRERRYEPLRARELTGETLGIVGYGGIGRESARLAKAFGMRVLAIRRHPASDAHADEVVSPSALDRVLAESDFLLISAPHTDETRDLVNRERLGNMKPGSMLLNVGRGEIVDEDALCDALESGHLGAAALDVTREEPLAESSRLWTQKNCVITPHDSGSSPKTVERVTDRFLENLERYSRGESLRDVVRAE